MKSTLIMAIVSALLAIVMVICIIFDIMTANWAGLAICVVALLLNTSNAIRGFKRWRFQKNLGELSIAARYKYSDLDS